MDYSNSSTYDPNLAYPTTHATSMDPANAAAVGVVFLFLIVLVIISYAISAYLLSRIFKKAGVEQWRAWVPVYNYWKLLQLGDQQGFWAILSIFPFVGIVSAIFIYIAMYKIGKKLGKEDWFVLIAIFLPIVWLIWLGFDDSKWQSDKKPVAAKKTKPSLKKTA